MNGILKKGTDTAEQKNFSSKGSPIFLHRLSFEVVTGKEQAPFTVTLMIKVHTGVSTYQPNK